MSTGQYDIKIRIIVSGETGVGKTCLLHQLCHREFRIPSFTLGVDQKFHNVLFQDRKIKLQIFDTAGNHRFKDIIKDYYKGVAAALIVYDVTQRETFLATRAWIQDCKLQCEANTTLVLVGNKSDIAAKRQVSTQEGFEFAVANRLQLFYETSAHSHADVTALMEGLVENVYSKLIYGRTSIGLHTGIRSHAMEPSLNPGEEEEEDEEDKDDEEEIQTD